MTNLGGAPPPYEHGLSNEGTQMETISISSNSPNGTQASQVQDGSPSSDIEAYDRKTLVSIDKDDSKAPGGMATGKGREKGMGGAGKFKQMLSRTFSSPKKKKTMILAHTPFGINRFALLVIYCVFTFMCGCPYWGWNGVQEMLYKSGAFENDCDPTVDLKTISVGIGSYIDCPARQRRINNMYTVAFACHFVISALMGTVLDIIGPKFTSMIGISCSALSWCLLAFSNETNFNAFYPAAAFMGISADPCYLPLLSVSNVFPGNESLVMSILGSVRSCSFAVPVIMSAIFTNSNSFAPDEFWKFCIGYVGVGLGISVIIAVLLVPMRPYKIAEDTVEEATLPEHEEAAARAGRRSSYTGTMQPPVFTSALDVKEIGQEMAGKTPDYEAHRAAYLEQRENPGETLAPVQRQPTSSPTSFFKTVKRPEFLLLLPFFCFTLIRAEFYTKSNKNQLVTTSNANVYEMFSIMNILSFLPGPIMGKLCDSVGILPVICLLNALGIFMYAFLIPDVLVCKGISVCFYFVYCSFCLSNLYCYIGATFAPEHFGKLTGLASMTAGLFALTSYGWYQLSTETLLDLYPYNFAPVNGILIALGIMNIPLWLTMYSLKKKKDKKEQAKIAPANVSTEV